MQEVFFRTRDRIADRTLAEGARTLRRQQLQAQQQMLAAHQAVILLPQQDLAPAEAQ